MQYDNSEQITCIQRGLRTGVNGIGEGLPLPSPSHSAILLSY